MKALLVFLLFIGALVGGFFAGRYYEANRSLDLEDVVRFKDRIAEEADDLKDSLTDKASQLFGDG